MNTHIQPRQASGLPPSLPPSLQGAPQQPTAEQIQQFQQELQNNPELQQKLHEQLQANPDLQKKLEQLIEQQGGATPGLANPGLVNPGQAAQQDPRQALLAQMHDVEDYGAVGLWPPAPGWWLLALLIISACGFSARIIWKKVQRNHYRKYALKELQSIRQADDGHKQAYALTQLLKRTFFSAYPNSRNRCAGIYGKQWLELLNQTSRKPLTIDQLASQWDTLLYSQQTPHNDGNEDSYSQAITELFTLTEQWIKHHDKTSEKTEAAINQVIQTITKNTMEASHA